MPHSTEMNDQPLDTGGLSPIELPGERDFPCLEGSGDSTGGEGTTHGAGNLDRIAPGVQPEQVTQRRGPDVEGCRSSSGMAGQVQGVQHDHGGPAVEERPAPFAGRLDTHGPKSCHHRPDGVIAWSEHPDRAPRARRME